MQCEWVAAELNRRNVKADFYHAGSDPAQRQSAQDRWSKGYVDVICATVAFGMVGPSGQLIPPHY